MKYISLNDQQTKNIAYQIAQEYKENAGVVALNGELGAGKTTFVQGFAEGLGIKDKIISPTFILMRQHQIPNTKLVLHHIDLYRMEGQIDIRALGIKELFDDPLAVVLIEWAEKISKDLPKNSTRINIVKGEKNNREIEIN